MLSREDIARMAKEAVAACQPSSSDTEMAGDMAMRQMWKALGKTKLAATEIDRLREEMLAAVRREAESAVPVQHGSDAGAGSNRRATGDRGFDVARWQARITVLVQGSFETTLDGTSQRLDAISGRARSLVEAVISSGGLPTTEAEIVRRLAEDAIAAERARLT